MLTTVSFAQVGIGTTTPAPSSILDLTATTKALLVTRVANTAAITAPVNGMIIYDNLNNCIRAYENGTWTNCLNGSTALPINPQICLPITTAVVELTSPVTGRIWMDRNLGAWRAATSSTDAYAYGDLYQYGRRTDGHQCRLSGTTTTQATTAQVPAPNTDKFIMTLDWTTPSPSEYWNETNTGVNDVVCPAGFRLPLQAEWEAEIAGWGTDKAAAAFSNLKLTLGGSRRYQDNTLQNVGSSGSYHSGIADSAVRSLVFDSTTASLVNNNFSSGRSVRCIKN